MNCGHAIPFEKPRESESASKSQLPYIELSDIDLFMLGVIAIVSIIRIMGVGVALFFYLKHKKQIDN